MDDMIDNAVEEAPETDVNTEEQVIDAPETEEVNKEGEEYNAPEEDFEPFPKKAVNALARRNKQIAKLKAEQSEKNQAISALEERLSRLENPAPREPEEGDFDNYGDYLKALATQGAQKEQPQQEQSLSREEILREAQEQIHYQNRMGAMQQQAQKAAQEIPDYANLHAEYSDVMDDLPADTVKAFLDADNAPAAFYALAKDGKIEQLPHMSPHQAAMEIARAEIRGQQMIEARKTQATKAPAPMKGLTGNSSGSSDPLAMSEADFMKRYL